MWDWDRRIIVALCPYHVLTQQAFWLVKHRCTYRSTTWCRSVTQPVPIPVVPCHNVWMPAAGRGSCGSWPSWGDVAQRWPGCAVGLDLSWTLLALWSGLQLQHLSGKQATCHLMPKKLYFVFFSGHTISAENIFYINSTKFICRQQNSKGVVWRKIQGISSPEKWV